MFDLSANYYESNTVFSEMQAIVGIFCIPKHVIPLSACPPTHYQKKKSPTENVGEKSIVRLRSSGRTFWVCPAGFCWRAWHSKRFFYGAPNAH